MLSNQVSQPLPVKAASAAPITPSSRCCSSHAAHAHPSPHQPRRFSQSAYVRSFFNLLDCAVVLDPARARCPGSVGDFSWGGMASTFFWIDPVENLSVVFFTQLSPSSSYPTRPQLKALVHAALTD